MSTAEQLRCQLVRAVYETQYHLVASELQLDIKAELKKNQNTEFFLTIWNDRGSK